MARVYSHQPVFNQVIVRMHAEDVASLFNANQLSTDIPVSPAGRRPQSNSLYLRRADKGRMSSVWYYFEQRGQELKHLSTGHHADDRSGAIAWVLTRQAQHLKDARARVSPEAMAVTGILDEYRQMVDEQDARGELRPWTVKSYHRQLILLKQIYRDKTVADVNQGKSRTVFKWYAAMGMAANSAMDAANTLKRAINWVMSDRGSAYRIQFAVGQRKGRGKEPFEPREIDRIMEHLTEGTLFHADGTRRMVIDEATGHEVPERCDITRARENVPFFMAVPFMLETATRNEASCEVSLCDPRVAHIDLDVGILNRRGEMAPDVPNKPRSSCALSKVYMQDLRPLAEALLARGITTLIHDWQGRPLKKLSPYVWKRILADCGVKYRVIHCLKDTAVQIARRECIPVALVAERFATTVATLFRCYGADWDLGSQIDAAEAQGVRGRWRSSYGQAEERRQTAREARARREAAVAIVQPLGAARPGAGGVAEATRTTAGRPPAGKSGAQKSGAQKSRAHTSEPRKAPARTSTSRANGNAAGRKSVA